MTCIPSTEVATTRKPRRVGTPASTVELYQQVERSHYSDNSTIAFAPYQ